MASDEEWGQRMAIAIFRSPVAQERVLDIEQAAARVWRIRDRLDASEHEIDGLKRDLRDARAEVERLQADAERFRALLSNHWIGENCTEYESPGTSFRYWIGGKGWDDANSLTYLADRLREEPTDGKEDPSDG